MVFSCSFAPEAKLVYPNRRDGGWKYGNPVEFSHLEIVKRATAWAVLL